ncbi:MAG: alpha/beta hydrolase family protein [Acidobacteriota bacterium]
MAARASSVAAETVDISAADGRRLTARWWAGAHAAQRSVVMLSGLAAPQEYLRWFAGSLAAKGWGVLTFDYRSVGKSINSESDVTASLDDWAQLDIPAAIREVRRRCEDAFLIVIGHSIGGQLLGQSPALKEVDGLVLIAAQRGIPHLYDGVARLRVHYAYAMFPLLIRTLGYLPISRLTFPDHCSPQAVMQWVNWGRTGTFTNMVGANLESCFADYCGRLIAITIADDEYAPPRAVDALTNLYERAVITRHQITPADYGVASLGHFGFFHRQAPRDLWVRMENWLREIEDNARHAAVASNAHV